MSKISKNIKQLRYEKNMTQDELAEKLNITRQAISSWENDRTQPDIQMLENLHELFGVSIEELIYGKKRNTTLELKKPSYKNSLIIVFSVLGSILVTAGLVLIFIAFWEKMPDIIRKGFAFLPIIIGQAAGIFVAVKKRDKKAWCEGGAVFWSVGVIAGYFLVQGVFNSFIYDVYAYIMMALSLLPVVFLLKSVCAMTAFYITGFMGVYCAAEGAIFESFGTLRYLAAGLSALLIYAVGLLLAKILRQTDKESHRPDIIGWVTAIAFPVFTFLFILTGSFDTGSAVAVVSAIVLAYFIAGQKSKALTAPMSFLGLFGATAFIFIFSYEVFFFMFGFGLDMRAEQIIPVLLQIIIVAFAIFFIRGKFASVIHVLLSVVYFILHILFIAYVVLRELPHLAPTPEEKSVLFAASDVWSEVLLVVILIFALAFFSLMIGLGAMSKKLTYMNTGFIGFAHQIIMFIIYSRSNIIITGAVLLICGGALLFANLKIAKSKKQQKTLPRTQTDGGGDNI